MRILLDKETDAIYVRFADAEVVESEEVYPGIVLDFDKNNTVVAIEVMHATARLGTPEFDRIDVQVA
ncbi:MAG: DUF2283 domain-containing protein [Thermomicrobiales bacterium]|nr:DUF2283 domain-containing protein [Thermomicrobiales bacterium]